MAAIGFVRIMVWQQIFHSYGDHAVQIACAVSLSLIGVVSLVIYVNVAQVILSGTLL